MVPKLWQQRVEGTGQKYAERHDIAAGKDQERIRGGCRLDRSTSCCEGAGSRTKFPLDPTKIIESLSDSTIYMSFYTISNIVRDIPIEKL